jgi:hypothetical protein
MRDPEPSQLIRAYSRFLCPSCTIGPSDRVWCIRAWRHNAANIRLIVRKSDRDGKPVKNGPLGVWTTKSGHINHDGHTVTGAIWSLVNMCTPGAPIGPIAIEIKNSGSDLPEILRRVV